MKFTELANRLTGISCPVFEFHGIQLTQSVLSLAELLSFLSHAEFYIEN